MSVELKLSYKGGKPRRMECELDPKYCDVIRKRWYKFTHGDEEGWQEGTPAI